MDLLIKVDQQLPSFYRDIRLVDCIVRLCVWTLLISIFLKLLTAYYWCWCMWCTIKTDRWYLKNCTQVVNVHGYISLKRLKVSSGVIQGILGPFFFIVYVNDIDFCIKIWNSWTILKYANHIRIFWCFSQGEN